MITRKEKFVEKVKQLAMDYWSMSLHDGSFESHFRDLLKEYENRNKKVTPEDVHRIGLKYIGYKDEAIEEMVLKYAKNCTYEFAESYYQFKTAQ